MKTEIKPTAIGSHMAITMAVYSAALVKLDDCRNACPGAGGGIDAMNLRHMIENYIIDSHAARQAAKTLDGLSRALDIDALIETEALRSVGNYHR